MKKSFVIFCSIILGIDLILSFLQYYYIPLDGDMAAIVVPSMPFEKMMYDPIGIQALLNHEIYMGPNRYFAHWTMKIYFESVPIFLQHFTDPINSIYLSCAIAKILTHIFLVFLIWFYCFGKIKISNKYFLLFVLFMSSMFQTYGFHSTMAIIDSSITYHFFYAWPICLLLCFYLPFFIRFYHQKEYNIGPIQFILLSILAIVMSFNGPLIPAVTIIISLILAINILLISFHKKYDSKYWINLIAHIKLIPKSFLYLYFFAILLSILSLYVGSFNSENNNTIVPILERYKKLPYGVFRILTENLGWPIVTCITIVNVYLTKRLKNKDSNKIMSILKYIGLFILIYILLLPLGGYREYRPFILRNDTLIPVTIVILILNGILIINNINYANRNLKNKYIMILLIPLMLFQIRDAKLPKHNVCEKKALLRIANSNRDTIVLIDDCTVLSWRKIKKAEDSQLNSDFLQKLNITHKNVLFYHMD